MKLWEPEEFDGLLGEFVNEHAPRLFAVTQVYREHLDARIVAWSFAFDDHADLVTTDQETWMSLQSPDNALLVFARPPHVSARIVWPGPPGVQDQ